MESYLWAAICPCQCSGNDRGSGRKTRPRGRTFLCEAGRRRTPRLTSLTGWISCFPSVTGAWRACDSCRASCKPASLRIDSRFCRWLCSTWRCQWCGRRGTCLKVKIFDFGFSMAGKRPFFTLARTLVKVLDEAPSLDLSFWWCCCCLLTLVLHSNESESEPTATSIGSGDSSWPFPLRAHFPVIPAEIREFNKWSLMTKD